MMSFWVVPVSCRALDPVLLGDRDVEGEQPGGGGVDRHRGVHLVERDAVEQRVHVALVDDRDADLADLAAGQRVIGVVPGLGGEVEGDREAGLALGQVSPVELVGAPGVGVPRVGAHHPGPVGLREAVLGSWRNSTVGGIGRVASTDVANLIDCMHLGRDRVIGAYELDGLIVDPGPSSCLEALLAGLEGEPRALLLTHIHLDHAGASGSLVAPVPEAARLRARGRGAAPGRPGEAARRAQAGCTATTWSASGARCSGAGLQRRRARAGESGSRGFGSPTPRATPATTSPTSMSRPATPTSATSPACASLRCEFTVAPTPPPDIDLEAWERSLKTVADWRPQRLCLTHFGRVDDVDRAARAPARGAARQRRARPPAAIASDSWPRWRPRSRPKRTPEVAERLRQAAPPEQLWLGLERYWRKRA